jgi:thiosulfate dehydrogenase (quinone) large subunit
MPRSGAWTGALGLLGIGVALILGTGMRMAAGAATLMMAMMWAAEWPLAQHTTAGEPTGSTNPITDYHVVYAIGTVVLALTYAGHTWGPGRWWARQPFVQEHHWFI